MSPPLNSTASACATCPGRCCYEYLVTVTGFDLWNIASRLALAPGEFLAWFPTDAAVPGAFILDQGGQHFDIALDKVRDERRHRPCIFLVELPGGVARCGIHAARPHVCQTYPAHLDREVVALRDDAMCPTGAWKLGRMSVAGWRRQMREFLVHRDLYARVARAWNQRVEAAEPGRCFSIDAYYDYLLNVYPGLQATIDAVGPEAWETVIEQWGAAGESGPGSMEPAAGFLASVEALLDRYRPGTAAIPGDAAAPGAAVATGPAARTT